MNRTDETRERAMLFVDGWHLSSPGVGLGIYTERVIEALLRCAGPALPEIRIAMPHWFARRPLAPAVRDSAVFLPCPRTGHGMLDQAVWQNRVALWSRRLERPGVFFSPGPFWALRTPRRCMVAFHDCIYRRFPEYLGRRGVRKWLLFRAESFLKRCDAVVTQSDSAKQDLLGFAGVRGDRVRVLPVWLPSGYAAQAASEQAPRVREKYALRSEPYWLYVGGYDYRKNIEFLLEAYARTCSRMACPPLVLAGRIPADTSKPVCDVHGALRRRDPAFRSRVLLPGFIAPDDMPGLYGGASLLVYPSLYEGYGLPPLEAMGCGCPAIVADNSSLPEVVTDDAYRFTTKDPDSLARLLSSAAGRPLPLNPAFRREAFSEEKAIAEYATAISEVLTS